LVLFGGSRHLRRHQRNAARGHCRDTPGRDEAGSQERPAFPIERFLEIAVVQFKFRTVLVVTRTHGVSPRFESASGARLIRPQFIATVKALLHHDVNEK
jgi:hypothetical protein